MTDFAGLVAMVTGGASGIGAATVEMLAERGATVFVYDRDPSASALPTVHSLTGDVTSDDDLAAAYATIEADAGGLDVLVNNAAISAVGDAGANDRDEWRRVLEVNVISAARVTALAAPMLRESYHPAVVNVSSFGALVGIRNRAVYCATKGAIDALTLAMAADYLADGIRVNAVAPGTADTPWVARLIANSADPDKELAALRGRQPMARLISPAEIAWAICYLASPHAGSTTATILPVDGGITGVRV
ncbi:MAG: short-chain dehydrogenase [Actinobacteria bacterium HGW-Actinobacteria-4]|nr:MAG: short-chain dehydrogenase [Actinobacteria bacterium HGW-Actinobacteria-4]